MLFRKSKLYLKNRLSGTYTYSDSELVKKAYADVLFINGCYLKHPSRYRVAHQREQLEAGNISTAEVFYKNLSLDYVKNFRMFIFFRCPYTDLIGDFIKKAKSYNKTVLFDIDDLMIDTKYTDEIPYVQEMNVQDRKMYEEGVRDTGKLLKLCDGAITTTEGLAEELSKYLPNVFINRNVASEEMIMISEKAWGNCKDKKDGFVKIGYFSGSITHNPDFAIVMPALVQIMKENSHVKLVLVGELDIPKELEAWKSRIIVSNMVNWRKLPELIASVDINIAPLEDTIFNRAKSENKWMEAALVRVVTVGSRVGAFEQMIQDGKTGILCENSWESWYENLNVLVSHSAYREQIAQNAYDYVLKNCTSVYTAFPYARYIRNQMHKNIVFVLPVLQISGGALVVLKHAALLQKQGYDVTIFNDGYEKVMEIAQDDCVFPVILTREMSIRGSIDKCVATLWSTTDFLCNYGKIKERFYFIQNYETDFYQPGEPLRIKANKTYCTDIPVRYITISKWCQEWLKEKYDIEAVYAPNGLDIGHFYPEKRDFSGRIRILVEGNSDDYYKNVDESFLITNQLDPEQYEIWYMSYQGQPKDWYRVDKFLHKVPYADVPDVYRSCHVLIKSSKLESFSYPPLEMMATGGLVLVAPNGGNIEYLKDGENCLFYEPGNVEQARKQLEQLLNDMCLKERLSENGIKTAIERSWSSIQNDIVRLYQ